jgi:hypothetical protein
MIKYRERKKEKKRPAMFAFKKKILEGRRNEKKRTAATPRRYCACIAEKKKNSTHGSPLNSLQDYNRMVSNRIQTLPK